MTVKDTKLCCFCVEMFKGPCDHPGVEAMECKVTSDCTVEAHYCYGPDVSEISGAEMAEVSGKPSFDADCFNVGAPVR